MSKVIISKMNQDALQSMVDSNLIVGDKLWEVIFPKGLTTGTINNELDSPLEFKSDTTKLPMGSMWYSESKFTNEQDKPILQVFLSLENDSKKGVYATILRDRDGAQLTSEDGLYTIHEVVAKRDFTFKSKEGNEVTIHKGDHAVKAYAA